LNLVRRDGAIFVVSRLTAPGATAVTFGRVVLIKPRGMRSERLIRHELVHVRQWRSLGAAGFARRYLGAYLRWRLRGHPHWAAYRRIPLEVEAEWLARQEVDGSTPKG
jgi:hypothetical protein